MKSNLVDVSVKLLHETQNAVLVSDSGTKDRAVWLPKSQIEVSQANRSGIVEITLPEWLAKDKGLL